MDKRRIKKKIRRIEGHARVDEDTASRVNLSRLAGECNGVTFREELLTIASHCSGADISAGFDEREDVVTFVRVLARMCLRALAPSLSYSVNLDGAPSWLEDDTEATL